MYSVNFEDMESIQYFQKAMESQGVFDRLREMGIEDGDTVRIYEIEFELAITAILHEVEKFTTLKAISKASGIKLPTLKQYASGYINPKEAQCEKIINAIRVIAQNLMDLTLA